MGKKKKVAEVDSVTVRNLHTDKTYQMPRAQWDAQKKELKGKFELVKPVATPPEVKQLAKKKPTSKAATTTAASSEENPGGDQETPAGE